MDENLQALIDYAREELDEAERLGADSGDGQRQTPRGAEQTASASV